MEIFLIIGAALIISWILGILLVTILFIILYPFDKRNYTHPKWHTIFPYIFKIQYKEKQKNGQNLVYTTTPDLLEFPFLGDSSYSIKREVYTKEYLESDEFKELREGVDKMMKQQKNK